MVMKRMSKKLLITGANGQLGTELQNILSQGTGPLGAIDANWSRWEVSACDHAALDITNKKDVTEYIHKHHFDAIINCAAATNVDGCEENPEFAAKLNDEAAGYVAQAAADIDATLVHVSTDYVFSGTDPMPQAEDGACEPNTAYGKTKFAGEQKVAKICPKSFIVRTAWLYGTQGKNFIRTMVGLGRNHDSIKVVLDQHGSPTFAGDLAWEILALLQTENYGIYHCTNNGATTWYDFARRIMQNAQIDCEVLPCTTEEFGAPAPRPAWSILDNKHLRDTIGDNMRSWDVALDEFMANVNL